MSQPKRRLKIPMNIPDSDNFLHVLKNKSSDEEKEIIQVSIINTIFPNLDNTRYGISTNFGFSIYTFGSHKFERIAKLIDKSFSVKSLVRNKDVHSKI